MQLVIPRRSATQCGSGCLLTMKSTGKPGSRTGR